MKTATRGTENPSKWRVAAGRRLIVASGSLSAREDAHGLLDELPEVTLDRVAGFVNQRLQAAARGEAAKPGDIVDEWGNLSALRRASSVRKVSRLDEEEVAEHGETIGDAWGHEPPKSGS